MIKELLESGAEVIQKIRDEEELRKLGNLRGGNSGSYQDNTFYGACPRITLLRMLGLQKGNSFSTKMIFQAGKCHEDYVKELLENCPDVKYIRDEYPVSTEIEGHLWTGRIDFLVGLRDGTEFIIETKSLTSNASVKKLYENKVPFVKALLQCATYKLITGIDARILYGFYFNAQQFNSRFSPEFMEFSLSFVGDEIILDGCRTGFKVSGLLNYHKKILECKRNKILPSRAVEKELSGVPVYDRCKYCPYMDSCTDYDQGFIEYDEFINEVKNIIGG